MLRRAANTRGSVEARRLAASATRSGLWRRSQRPWSRGASMDIRVRESGRCAPTFGPEGRIAREKPGRGCKKSLLIYERGDLWVGAPCLSVREPCCTVGHRASLAFDAGSRRYARSALRRRRNRLVLRARDTCAWSRTPWHVTALVRCRVSVCTVLDYVHSAHTDRYFRIRKLCGCI